MCILFYFQTSSSSSVSPIITSAIGPLPGPVASTVTSPALPQATATPLVTIPCLPSSSPTCDVSVETCNVGVVTEPECLGPCDPGTCVNLEGIVWHESHNGKIYNMKIDPALKSYLYYFAIKQYNCKLYNATNFAFTIS